MKRTRKYLTLSLFLCCSLILANVSIVNAEEPSGEQTAAQSGLTDENTHRLDEVTAMNSDGDIYEIDDTGGEVKTSLFSLFARSTSPQVVNFRTKGYEVTYYTDAKSGAQGYLCGAYGADAAYLGYASDDTVKFMQSGVVGYVKASDVQVVNLSDAKSYSCYKVSNGRLLHYVTQDMTTPGHATSLDQGNAPSYLSAGTTYYSYDGQYFYTDYGTMLNDYQNNVRSQSVNASNPFYNYYQCLSLRSSTAYSAAELDSIINSKTSSSSKLRGLGTSLIKYQNQYNVNAMAMLSVAVNESGWGMSSICQSKNNLFGLNAVDTSPGASSYTFSSPDECVRQFAETWMNKWYLNPSNWTCEGDYLGNKGAGINVHYASDPYWGERAANIAYNLDSIGGGKDTNRSATTEPPAEPEPSTPPVATVSSLTLSMDAVTVKQGDNITFGVSVQGENDPAQTVTWNVSGAASANTVIDENGKLQIAEDETAQTVSVTATSTVDSSKSATAIVTITKKSTQGEPGNSETTTPTTPTTPAPTPTEPNGTDEDEKVPTKVDKVVDGDTNITATGDFTSKDTLKVSPINQASEEYKAYTAPVSKQTILGVFDITLSKELAEGESVQLIFPVEAVDGTRVVALHYPDIENPSAKPDYYTTTVEAGKISIDTSSFSPYVIALDDAPPANDPDGDLDGDSDGEPVTTPDNTPTVTPPVVNTPTFPTVPTTDGNEPSTTPETTTNPSVSTPAGETTKGDVVAKVSTESIGQNAKVEINNNLSPNQTTNAVKTGDNDSYLLWIMAMLLAVGCVTGICLFRKKRA